MTITNPINLNLIQSKIKVIITEEEFNEKISHSKNKISPEKK
jgi:hypothetical protein